MTQAVDTAATLVIGNEILSGKVQDINSTYQCKSLSEHGVEVRTILTIPDEVERIGSEAKALSDSHTWVFTSGGIGPTHDDITIASIAAGFNAAIIESPQLLERLKDYYGDRFTEAHQRMAQVPEGAKLIRLDEAGRFQIQFKNLYIFPGIPQLLMRRFDSIKERFRSAPIFLKQIFLNIDEGEIAAQLEGTLEHFPELNLGSYPSLESAYDVKLTLESRSTEYLESALDFLLKLLPPASVLKIETL